MPLLMIGFVIGFMLFLSWLLRPATPVGAHQPDPSTDWRKKRGLDATVAEQAPATGKNYLVIGTGGVGLALVEALVNRGESNVVGFDVATGSFCSSTTTMKSSTPTRFIIGMQLVFE